MSRIHQISRSSEKAISYIILSTSDEGVVRRWPLPPAAGDQMREIWSQPGALIGQDLKLDPDGRFAILTERFAGKVLVVPVDGSKTSIFELNRREGTSLWSGASTFDPAGRFVALGVKSPGHPDVDAIRILDLASGDERTLDTHPKSKDRCIEAGAQEGYAIPAWLPDGRLLSDGDAGLLVWDLNTGTSKQLRPCKWLVDEVRATPDSKMILSLRRALAQNDTSTLSIFDLVSRTTREVTSNGNRLTSFALDARGTILVTADMSGVVRVGPLTGEEPHLLFGHTGPVTAVAVSPDGRWIASGGADGTIRLWPMPDLSKPPLHTLPHDRLLAKLRSLTNLRAVRDSKSDTGYKIEIGPFPGWKDAPTW